MNKDVFSSGQVSSKVWLCEELERTRWTSDETAIYAGWYGLTAFLLLTRNKFKVNRIRSYDIDPACEPMADMINENWVWQNWKFKALTADCLKHITTADLVINTSTEHFETMEWFENIPYGTRVVLQGNNMKHDDHVVYTKTLQDFVTKYPLSEVNYQGSLHFVYPDWNFRRYMQIGVK